MAETTTQRKIIVQKLQVNQLLSKNGSHPADTRLLVEILIDGNVAHKTQDNTVSKKSGDLSWNWSTDLRIPGDINEFTLRVLQHRSWGKNKSLGIVAIRTGELIRKNKNSFLFSSEVTHRLIATNPGPLMEITLGYSVDGVSTKPEAVDMTRRVVSDSPASDRFTYADVTPASHGGIKNQSVSSLTSLGTWRSESPTIDGRSITPPPHHYSSLSSLRESEGSDKQYAPPPAVTRVDNQPQINAENDINLSTEQTPRPTVNQTESYPTMNQERRPPLEPRAETTPVWTQAVDDTLTQASEATKPNYFESDNNSSGAGQRVAYQNQGQTQSQAQQYTQNAPTTHKRAGTRDQAQMQQYIQNASAPMHDHVQQQDPRPNFYQTESSPLPQSRLEQDTPSQAVYRSETIPFTAHANPASTKPADNSSYNPYQNYTATQQTTQYAQPQQQQQRQQQEQAQQYILSEPVTSPSSENENRQPTSMSRESNSYSNAPLAVPSASQSIAMAGVSLAIPPYKRPLEVSAPPVSQYTNEREAAGAVKANTNDSYTRGDVRSSERTAAADSRTTARPDNSFNSQYNVEQGQREAYKQSNRDNSERNTENNQYSRSTDQAAQNRSQNQSQVTETRSLAPNDARVQREIESAFIATRDPRLVQEYRAIADSRNNESNNENRQGIIKPTPTQYTAMEESNARTTANEPRFERNQYQSNNSESLAAAVTKNDAKENALRTSQYANNDNISNAGKLSTYNDVRTNDPPKTSNVEYSRRNDDRKEQTQAQSSYKSDAPISQSSERREYYSAVPVPSNDIQRGPSTYSHIPHQGFSEFTANITPPRSMSPANDEYSKPSNNVTATPASNGNIPQRSYQPQNISEKTHNAKRESNTTLNHIASKTETAATSRNVASTADRSLYNPQGKAQNESRAVLEYQEPVKTSIDKSKLPNNNTTYSSNSEASQERFQFTTSRADKRTSAATMSTSGQSSEPSNNHMHREIPAQTPNNTVNPKVVNRDIANVTNRESFGESGPSKTVEYKEQKVASSAGRVDIPRSDGGSPLIVPVSNDSGKINKVDAVKSSQSNLSSTRTNQIKADTNDERGRSQAVSAPVFRPTDNSQQNNNTSSSNNSRAAGKALKFTSQSFQNWNRVDSQRPRTAPAVLRPTRQSKWPFDTSPYTLSRSSDSRSETEKGRNRSRSFSRHVEIHQKGQPRRSQSWPGSRQPLIMYRRHKNSAMKDETKLVSSGPAEVQHHDPRTANIVSKTGAHPISTSAISQDPKSTSIPAVTENRVGNLAKNTSIEEAARISPDSKISQSETNITNKSSPAMEGLSVTAVASLFAAPQPTSPTITFINSATTAAVDEWNSITSSALPSPTSTLVQSPPMSVNNSTSSSATLGSSASPSNLPIPLLDTGMLGPAESLSRSVTPILDGKKQGVFNKLITGAKNAELKEKANELNNIVAPIVAPLIARVQGSETPQLLAGALQFLNRFVQVADTLKKAHPILDISITALTVAYKLIRNQTIQDQAIRHLSLVMNDMLACAQGVITDVTFGHLQRIIDRMFNEVRDCAEFIQTYFHRGFWGRTARLAVSSYSTDMIERFQHSFTDLKGSFNMAMSVQSLTSIEAVRQDIKELRADVDRGFDEVKARDLLKSLDRVRQVQNDDECFCLPETRTELIRIIHSWIDSKEGGNFFWLPALSGWGKSTISATIRKEYIDANSSDNSARQRGAWFFCDRDSGRAEFADLNRIIPTLAYHLAHAYPGMKASLVEQLDINQDIISWNIENQVRRLISEPLRKLIIPLSGPIVCIIDDVDACLDSARTSQASLRAFFRCISGSAVPLPSWLKIFVTSRPLEFIEEQRNAIMYYDVDLNHPDNRADVSIYVQHRLTTIQKKRNLPNSWQKDKYAKELDDRAAGLFRWAQLALDFVEESSDDDVDRLINFVLIGKRHGSSPIEEVRSLYKKIRLYKNDLWDTGDDRSRGHQGMQKFGTF